ncbi:MAG TPA: hypothetical protein VMM13_13780, partial [Euzebya sp.]|nr:hypothetical protein [Euzebya sp.]
MAGKARRNRGGTVRKLTSGRYQVRVRDQATNRLVSIGTYPRKADADAALRAALTEQDHGTWINPEVGGESVAAYAQRWIRQNPRITSPRTRERYDGVLRLHIA